MEQRSQEWLDTRREHIGSSDAGVIMGVNPYKTPYMLWREKSLGEVVPMNYAMQWGTDLEPVVRAKFEEKHGKLFPPKIHFCQGKHWMMASLDGMSEDGIILEIKCTNPTNFASIFLGDEIVIPEHWEWQIQHQFEVTKAKKGILLVTDGERSMEIWVSPDQQMIDELVEKETHFLYEHMCNMTPPPLQKGDYVEKTDSEWMDATAEFIEAKADEDKASERKEKARAKLIKLADGKNCRGGGVTASKYTVKGTVDFYSIPVIKDMDLEKYRKPSKEQWRIT